VDKISPDSVEVIPEVDDEEDMSVADDSYTSASESTTTATTTIMEQPPLPFTSGGKTDSDAARSPHHKPYSVAEPSTSNDSSLYSSTVSIKTDSGDVKSPLASTRTSQHSLSLLDSSYNDSLILTEVQPKAKVEEPILTHGSGRTGLTLLLAHGEVPSANEEGASFLDSKTERSEVSYKVGTCANDSSNEEGSSLLSDSRTLIPTDSSCDGTSAMESSSEDTTGTMVADDSSNEGNSKAPFQQTSSFYVKTMLADAMGEDAGKESGAEQLMPARDQSPISSERFVLQAIYLKQPQHADFILSIKLNSTVFWTVVLRNLNISEDHITSIFKSEK
jgi:hypothetical protein